MLRCARFLTTLSICFVFVASSTAIAQGPGAKDDPFRQLEEWLPTPNLYRNAAGAPGAGYWQQRVDYDIDVELDDLEQRIRGSERIHYTNHSPDTLSYLWVQLEQNLFHHDSSGNLTQTAPDFDKFGYSTLRKLLALEEFDGGYKLGEVLDASGNPLETTTVGTMLRIDLPTRLNPSESFDFSISWEYQINESEVIRSRTGYEYFKEDGNYLYELAHWFPRLAPYEDVNGWQNKQFLGNGEFALEFGDYRVRITAPSDHVVAATGVLQNPEEVLTSVQRERLEQSKTANKPMFVITPEEAEENEKGAPNGTKTWVFQAENVRDFAFASSRKFIWDAMGCDVGGERVMAMSYWPKEGEPLWSRYSTHAIIHTLDVYSKFTFDYPYPVAISVNGPVGGMEYPMICFNGPRPEKDGTYTERTKYGLISVIIHEVGHNYFPMIVNSDERQWTWMDEGLNTFVQYLAEQEWEDEYPSRRGEPQKIVNYMSSANQVPIMTNSESLLQFGSNAYAKPATALNILRETVMGRELFDFAFREYAQRWMFKRPMPADLFRTMEDASAVDLDWFWRGWFYTTQAVDLGIVELLEYELDTRDPDIDKPNRLADRNEEPQTLGQKRNADLHKRSDDFPELLDFYNEYDELDVTAEDREAYRKLIDSLEPHELELLDTQRHFYVARIQNVGGLVMPVILEIEYVDGTVEELRIGAEIWRKNSKRAKKLLLTEQEIVRITLDPHLETADIDRDNNVWPPEAKKSRFKLFKSKKKKNPMQKALAAEKKAAKEASGAGAEGEDVPAESATNTEGARTETEGAETDG